MSDVSVQEDTLLCAIFMVYHMYVRNISNYGHFKNYCAGHALEIWWNMLCAPRFSFSGMIPFSFSIYEVGQWSYGAGPWLPTKFHAFFACNCEKVTNQFNQPTDSERVEWPARAVVAKTLSQMICLRFEGFHQCDNPTPYKLQPNELPSSATLLHTNFWSLLFVVFCRSNSNWRW